MSRLREFLPGFILVIASFALAGALYGRLPDPVPTHWNMHGVADGFMPKPWGAFILPVVTAATYLLLILLPAISPRGYRIDRFRRVFVIVRTSIVGFLFLATGLGLFAGIGVPLRMDRLIQVGLGLTFLVLGNYMGKLTKNFFLGIRTPWTLASDEVWSQTHRLGGRVFVVAGLVLLVSALLDGGTLVLLPVAVVSVLVPIVYSYFIYRRIEGFKNHAEKEP